MIKATCACCGKTIYVEREMEAFNSNHSGRNPYDDVITEYHAQNDPGSMDETFLCEECAEENA